MKTRIGSVLFLITALCGFIPTNGYSSDNISSEESIRGIKGVYVMAEVSGNDEIKHDINDKIILKDAVLRLKDKDIKTFSEEEYRNLNYIPMLRIHIDFLKLDHNNEYAYFIDVELIQLVTLNRNKLTKSGTTWSESRIGLTSANKLNETREQIKDVVDIFIKAYHFVNPKK